MTDAVQWFREQSAGAPAALRSRAERYLERQPTGPTRAGALAAAARDALAATLAHPGGRAVALDLLAADALVTLALKASAGEDPEALGRFARELTSLGSGVR